MKLIARIITAVIALPLMTIGLIYYIIFGTNETKSNDSN